ncbi:hypothetical protein PLESTB_001720000 [Pleodorina starrii]|uniref:26S proteasome non-ATPase regulatory subunit 5 n=1 Tax=Pleodorina starrii TaxID=330485 RepID=A0A9W6C0F9_9CHLO|nr:hypothetical protein PLESTB_001720000 [Pleodorina starrii]
MDAERDSAELVKACRELHAMPQALTDAHAHAFFSEFPLESIFRALASTHDRADISLVSDTLGRVLATDLGSSIVPNALPYLEAASSAPAPALRRLAAEQYGSLLLAQVRRYDVAPLSGDGGGGGAADDDDGGVTDSACWQLVRMLSDPDTVAAAAAAKALRMYGSSSLAALQRLLSPGSAISAALVAAAASDELAGVVRLRVVALALELAAGGDRARPTLIANGIHKPHPGQTASTASAASAASAPAGPSTTPQYGGERLQLLRDSGLLQPLLDQLADPSDALACLAALQLLEDLLAATDGGDDATAAGGVGGDGGMAAALASLALPQLLALVSEPTLADAAMPLVAGILRRSLPAAPPTAALAAALGAAANGAAAAAAPSLPSSLPGGGSAAAGLPPALAAAPALLSAVHAVLDDRGDACASAEACGLDALGTLGQSAPGAQLVMSDERLVRAMCERALGRSPHPEVRIAALHCLASAAGLERAGGLRDRTAAILPQQCEEALRRGVYGACGVRRPAEVLAGMLQQPFLELRLAAYRCIAAMSLRSWFAVEVVTTPDLYDRITDARSDSGAVACNWRHTAAAALWATVSAAAAAAAGSGEAAFAATLAVPATVERVRAAVRAGPYGTEGDGAAAAAAAAAEASRMHGEHFVASRGAGGGGV